MYSLVDSNSFTKKTSLRKPTRCTRIYHWKVLCNNKHQYVNVITTICQKIQPVKHNKSVTLVIMLLRSGFCNGTLTNLDSLITILLFLEFCAHLTFVGYFELDGDFLHGFTPLMLIVSQPDIGLCKICC